MSLAYILGTFLCRRLLARHGLRGAVRRGAWFTLVGGASMALLSLAGVRGVWAILLPQYIYAIGHGVHQPCGQAAAVGPFPDKAGTAASLSGFVMTVTALGVGLWIGQHAGRRRLSADLVRRRLQRRRRRGRLDAGAAPRRAGRNDVARWRKRNWRERVRPRATDALSCLCIAGPTASGKSAAALAIADALLPRRRVEIVSVDSAQVYRGMDIGTAKPTAAERRAVPHHLIDIVEPTDRYSAARFVADATRLIAEIEAREALPLLVGGTMLYFKALFGGLDAMPAADAAVRAEIDARARAVGWPALHAELAALDPPTAARLSINDAQRIQRALEVHRLSGKPLSAVAHRAASRRAAALCSRSSRRERAWLHARIEARFAAMLEAGLVDEVRALRARGDLDAELPSMRAVGYRQTWAALEAGDCSALQASGSAATRQLAKRQLTWLRAMPWRHVVACDAPDAIGQAIRLAKQLAPA